jgi:hypothetical protein
MLELQSDSLISSPVGRHLQCSQDYQDIARIIGTLSHQPVRDENAPSGSERLASAQLTHLADYSQY